MKTDIPRCRNCEYHCNPFCMINLKNDKPIKTSPNDWCNKWEEEWKPTKKELEESGFFKKE